MCRRFTAVASCLVMCIAPAGRASAQFSIDLRAGANSPREFDAKSYKGPTGRIIVPFSDRHSVLR